MPGSVPTSIQELLGVNTRLLSFSLDDGIPVGDDPQSKVRWHKIGIEGEWEGHWMGPFALTRKDFEQAALLSRSQKTDILVDYEHKSLFSMFTAAESRAAGWGTALEVRDNPQDGSAELWARIEWTRPAALAIRDSEYKYTSPVYRWRTPDRVSGADLGTSVPSIALTNTPFLEELPEVTLNSLGLLGRTPPSSREVAMFSKDQIPQLLSALGLKEGASADEVLAALQTRQGHASALTAIREALGAGADMDANALATGIKALRSKLEAAPSQEAVSQLQAEMKALRVNAALDRARRNGQLVADNEAFVRSLAEKDMALFDEWEKTAPQVVALGQVKQASGARAASQTVDGVPTDEQIKSEAAALNAGELAAARACKMTPEEYVKYGKYGRQITGNATA